MRRTENAVSYKIDEFIYCSDIDCGNYLTGDTNIVTSQIAALSDFIDSESDVSDNDKK